MAHDEDQPVLVFRRQTDRRQAPPQRKILDVLAYMFGGLLEHRPRDRVAGGATSRRSSQSENPVELAQLESAAVASAEITSIAERTNRTPRFKAGRIGKR